MGFNLAKRLLSRRHKVFIYNRTKNKILPLVKQGAFLSESVNAAISKADFVLVLLTDEKAIRDVLFNRSVKDLQGKMVVQMSTISPDESRINFKKVEALKGKYLECPILGSKKEALSGNLLAMVAGNKSDFNKARALIKSFCPNPRYIGPVGKAASLKLALNNLIASHAAGFSISMGIVEKNKIDLNTFMDILRESSLYAGMFDKKLNNWKKRNYGSANFVCRHLLKDIRLIKNESLKNNISTNVTVGIEKEIIKAIKNGWGEKDYSVIFNAINNL